MYEARAFAGSCEGYPNNPAQSTYCTEGFRIIMVSLPTYRS